jgi:hypothetical protein
MKCESLALVSEMCDTIHVYCSMEKSTILKIRMAVQ